MISIFMSSRPCVQILYFASLAFLANCIYNFIFYFFFCGNLFCLKKMTVCVLRVFLAIFLSLLTYFFSCSVSQSLRVSLSSFHFFFSIYFRRFLHYFCPHRTQKYLFATFVFETILSACLQFSFYFFLETCFAFSLQNRFAPFQI